MELMGTLSQPALSSRRISSSDRIVVPELMIIEREHPRNGRVAFLGVRQAVVEREAGGADDAAEGVEAVGFGGDAEEVGHRDDVADGAVVGEGFFWPTGCGAV